MKKYLLIVLIAFHLITSSLYATKTFLEKDHIHSYIDRCSLHQHHHTHNGSHHQHKHSHSQINITFVDFFVTTEDTNTLYISNASQIYLETIGWIPNPILESLFRPPKI